MNCHTGNNVKLRFEFVILVVLLIVVINSSKAYAADQEDDFICSDVYTFRDKTGNYEIARITFRSELIQNNQLFTLFQTVDFELIKHPIISDWGIKSLHFETEDVSGTWENESGYLVGWVIVPPLTFHYVDLEPNKSITVNQTVNPSSFWSGNRFSILSRFHNMRFETENQNDIHFPISVFFRYNENGNLQDPVVDDIILDDFEVNPWEIINAEYEFLFYTIIGLLFILLIFSVFYFRNASLELKHYVKNNHDRDSPLLKMTVYERTYKFCKSLRWIFLAPYSIYMIVKYPDYRKLPLELIKLQLISKTSKSLGWMLIPPYSIYKLITAINQLKVNFGNTDLIFGIIILLFMQICPQIIRLIQKSKMRFKLQKYGKEMSITYLEFIDQSEKVLVKLPQIREIAMLVIGLLVSFLLEHIVRYFG